ncbi:aminotransferase class I/II-fold pyridoxal phosphate-dependent enzyme [bacterium]|nr:aminotransferase class I/II-fold pyridoxal phosphate-dependent enzyme [bacterium]
MNIQQARRLRELPPYIFSELNAIKADASKRGIQLTSLAIGDPDKPTPPEILKFIQEASLKPENHAYSPYEGTPAFRQSVATWMQSRFGVSLDPQKEIVALIGSKEGIAHFPVAFCDPGDKVLYPSPGYPVFATSISLGGGQPIPIPLTPESGFVPDPQVLEDLFRTHQPKYAILNFPSNPTSATLSLKQLTEIVGLAKKYSVWILFDNAYSEIYFDEKEKPPSILEVPGAKDICIELQSFSKSYNMTGWRIGFAAGNPELVGGLLRAKTNIDSGPLLAVQEACTRILPRADEFSGPIRDLYSVRRDAMLSGLQDIGIEVFAPKATFFVWARVPNGGKSMDFTKHLIEKTGVVVTPGIGFGDPGEGFFRLALTVDPPQIHAALQKLKDALPSFR